MFIVRIVFWKVIKFFIRLNFRDVRHLSTRDLAIWLDKNKQEKPLLLDCRTKAEYQVSHLNNARLVPTNLDNLITWNEINFSTPIIVYCSVGYRSAMVARNLQSLGYQKVFNLNGSIFQWFNEGRSIYQSNKLVKVVHPYNRFWAYLLESPDRNIF